MIWKDRYLKAHEEWFKIQYPNAYKDGHYAIPTIPKVAKANGLTNFVINYLSWRGHRATRINVQGQLVKMPEKQASGVVLTTLKFRPSTTRRGTADISSTINGRSVMWEVKTGRDVPSSFQLSEQEKEKKAGGEYFFIHNPEEFFNFYDELL